MPRGCPALAWLRGQRKLLHATPGHPVVYFSPRKTAAPETAGSKAAQEEGESWNAIAGEQT